MKLDADLSTSHAKSVQTPQPHYHIVHSMEPETSNIAVTTDSYRDTSPLIPALYCLFFAEETEKGHLSTEDIMTLLVRFYGFKRVPLDDTAIEIDLCSARDEYCAIAAKILQQPHSQKEGLNRAIRECKPMGFTTFLNLATVLD